MKKTCLDCKNEKSLSAFGKSKGIKRFYPRSRCKKCAIIKLHEWRERNPAKVRKAAKQNYRKNINVYKERARKDYLRNPEVNRRRSLIKNYGITDEQFNRLLEYQGGVCAICWRGINADDRKKRLSVDHDHQTGKIRGLLCSGCNGGIGFFNDNLEVLKRAVNYLELEPPTLNRHSQSITAYKN